MAKGFDTQLQDIAVKKKQKLETFKVLLIKKKKVRCHLSKGHIRKANQLKDLSMALTYLKHKQV
jgi:hypothetical protein